MADTDPPIPLLDLSLASSPETLPDLLTSLRHALLHVGFMYIKNHSIPESAISDLQNALPTLFSLPKEAKEEIALSNSPHFLGYSGEGTETTAGQRDGREQVELANELSETWEEGRPLAERLRGPNQWPSRYPGLRPIVETYISHLTLLGNHFLTLVAQALSLPPSTFHPFLSDQHRLKLVRYPPVATPTQGVGPHKDSSGWWTFLLQASSDPSIKGLQVLSKSGTWLDVPNIPGTLVVNIGQAFEVVTHGVCKATTHRVVMEPNPDSEAAPQERFSVPFFQGVRRDLTKEEALGTLRGIFEGKEREFKGEGEESEEGQGIDSAFLKGKYETWGESQLRTKIRSHRDVGRRFYGDVFEKYVSDD